MLLREKGCYCAGLMLSSACAHTIYTMQPSSLADVQIIKIHWGFWFIYDWRMLMRIYIYIYIFTKQFIRAVYPWGVLMPICFFRIDCDRPIILPRCASDLLLQLKFELRLILSYILLKENVSFIYIHMYLCILRKSFKRFVFLNLKYFYF